MSKGILICGADGSGKSTFGEALAADRYMDIEAYYFDKSAVPYSRSRTKKEAGESLLKGIQKGGDFVLSSVKGDFGEPIISAFCCAVYRPTGNPPAAN